MNRWSKKFPNKFINKWTMLILVAFIGCILNKILISNGNNTYLLGMVIGMVSFGVLDYFDSL